MDESSFGPVEIDGTELRPVFDPRMRTFSIQLWKDGQRAGNHGLADNFVTVDEPLEEIDAFLADAGIRAVTEDERFTLYGGLLRAKGGVDFHLFLLELAKSQTR
ncbi:hypothetical protein ACFYWP_37120 [Actinacidiphila glaucinigra]|uniref:hypothetical protein n=1 Tax=Actinacidiphila glaucinigra TaxID=235986 RepID=UPI00369B1231